VLLKLHLNNALKNLNKIDKEGNLIGVGHETEKEPDTISVADIRNELFEGDNIVVGKTDYGQSQLKSGPFSTKKE